MSKEKLIYINGRFLNQHVSGVQRFATQVTAQLTKLENYEIIILAPRNTNLNKIDKGLKTQQIGFFYGYFWEQIELPIYLYLSKSPILLNLTNLAPIFYFNKLYTLHDTAFIDAPDSFNWKYKLMYRILVPLCLISSIKIFTVSKFSKSRIVKNYPFIRQNKISVVYNGSNFGFKKKEVVNKKKVILSVASIDKRKNTALLISAFNIFNKKGQYKLILVGKFGKAFKKSEIREQQNIEYRTHVSDTDLKELYLTSSLYVNLSIYEGFGLPILEALTLGIKVLCSDIEVFRELFGGKVFFTKISDPYVISSNINRALSSSNKNKPYQINKFSWKKTASIIDQNLKEIYK
jgi:glycosyltransferase involved in cell wall biosynthesis